VERHPGGEGADMDLRTSGVVFVFVVVVVVVVAG
jgi:hypothetical protein